MGKQAYRKRFEREDKHWWFLSRRGYLSAYLSGAEGGRHSILDIGCGTGGTSVFLRKFGDVVGVEIDEGSLLLAADRDLRVMAGDAENLPAHSEEYDIALMLDVLSHKRINSEIKALREAYRVLKPGGTILISVPAYRMFKSPYDKILGITRRYNRQDAVTMIERAGFRVERATYLFWLLAPISLLGRLLERLLGLERIELPEPSPWLIKLLIWTHKIEAKMLGFIELPWGSSVMVRARKPNDPQGGHVLRAT